jgi:hypothetical protein
MLSRDLVPIAPERAGRAGIGKPLRIAVDNRIGARGADAGKYPGVPAGPARRHDQSLRPAAFLASFPASQVF